MRCLNVVEGEEFDLGPADAARLREAVVRLRLTLKPSFSIFSERGDRFRLDNVIGTIDIGVGTVIQVSPKVPVEHDWTTAVIALLSGKEAIDVAGERHSAGLSSVHNRLLDAVAGAYLRRLERAFRQEGPIVLLEQRRSELPCLHGKLDASRWAQSALWRPHVFPVVRTEFAADNPFTRGLLLVADTLALACSNLRIRAGLRAISRDLSAGLPKAAPLQSGTARRVLPEQWSAYKPAWSMAMAILSRSSLFGTRGSHVGLGLAIEAWPLLEALLARTLQAMGRAGRANGRQITARMKGEAKLLTPKETPQQSFSPEPDGRLYEGETLLATFEAKYSAHNNLRPVREHTYQALATAAACGAPIAVLVYPERFAPQIWYVSGMSGRPGVLIAVGLGLYNWLRPDEEDMRGSDLLSLLDTVALQNAAPKAPALV